MTEKTLHLAPTEVELLRWSMREVLSKEMVSHRERDLLASALKKIEIALLERMR